jgi:hypothetical protein
MPRLGDPLVDSLDDDTEREYAIWVRESVGSDWCRFSRFSADFNSLREFLIRMAAERPNVDWAILFGPRASDGLYPDTTMAVIPALHG